MHDIGPVGLEVAARRLLDVLHPFVALRRRLAHLPQEGEQISDVGAALVEVQRIAPVLDAALLLGRGGDAIDAHQSFDVPVEIVAVEFDLEVRQAVGANPFGQRLGQAIADALLDVGVGERVEGADEMVQRQSRHGSAANVLLERLAGELRPQIVAEVVVHESGAIRLVTAQAVDLAVSVVQGGIESLAATIVQRCGIGSARWRSRLTSSAAFKYSGSRLRPRSRGWPDSPHWPMMTARTTDQVDHGGEGLFVGQHARGERPDVAQRHGAEAACALTGRGLDVAVHVEESGAVDGNAAELDGRAVVEVLVAVFDGANADVGRSAHAATSKMGEGREKTRRGRFHSVFSSLAPRPSPLFKGRSYVPIS